MSGEHQAPGAPELAEARRKVPLAADATHAGHLTREVADALVTAAHAAYRETCRPALTSHSGGVQRAAHQAWQAACAARQAAETFLSLAQAELAELVTATREAERQAEGDGAP